MLATLMLLVAAIGPAVQQAGDEPGTVIRAAQRAVEGDSATRVAERWETRLRRDPGDRMAALGLATLARFRYEYADAERRFQQLDALDASQPDAAAVYARLGLAQAADTRGMLEEATAQFTRALAGARIIGDPAAEAEALLGLAFTLATTEGIEPGLVYIDSAERVLPAEAVALRADMHRRRAVLLAVLSRPEAAAEAAACTALTRRAGETRLEAHCHRAAALDLRLRGLDDSSLVILREAERLHRISRDRSMLGETLQRRADAQRSRGDFGAARAALDEALVEAKASHSLLGESSAYVGLGSLAIRLNDFAAASEYLRRAVEMFEEQGNTGGAIMARGFLTSVYAATGNTAQARREGEEVLAWYQRVGEVVNEIEMIRALASLEMREHDWPAARRMLDSAASVIRRHDMAGWLDGLAIDYGRLALYQGDLEAAERSLARYLDGLDSTQHMARHEVRARLAEVHARRGDLARAETELKSAGDELDRWRASLADRELRILAFEASATEDDEDRTSAPRVLALLARGGRSEAAFALAERRRARELADRLARAAALRVEGEGERHVPRARAGVPEPAALAAALPDEQTAIVEYVAGADGAETTIFVLTRAGVQSRVVPTPDSLPERIGRFVALLETGGDPRGLARALGAALLDPVAAALDPSISRLIVVPDGALHRLPFDALRLADGRYVVERFTVSVAPSAAVVAALWRRPRGAEDGTPVRLLAFGDPAFAGESDAGGEAVDRDGERLPRLPASGREARRVARYAAEADLRLRDEASGAFLKHTSLTPYRIIHFATHALVDDRSTARTALALAAGDGEDGFVTPGDLAALDLTADLVVLSACRTAGGVVVDGEGVQGLTGPLLEAGARSVVATGWRIGDRATVSMVEDFYDALAGGLPVGEALREAKLAAMRRGAPPGEWAAFTIVGDPTVRIPLRQPTPGTVWAWGTAAAAGLLLAGLYSARMRRDRKEDDRSAPSAATARTRH